MNFSCKLLVAAVTFLVTCEAAAADIPSNCLTHIQSLGTVQGKPGQTHFTQRPVCHYLGINYAKSPSGDLRFNPPVEAPAWSGIYNATKMRQRCPQADIPYYPSPDPESLDIRPDKEDCLVVNVFAPLVKGKAASSPMPVMFYLHGGSFYLGSAYDFLPDFLLEKDVVLVVPQYRLGPLGFLSLNTTRIPGNAGMLDILQALKWTNKHIAGFGGDPAKITVVGQSAGAAAASALLISPLVETGLFDKVILESGSILGTWTVDDDPMASAKGIARLVGCPDNNVLQMEYCFVAAPADKLVKAHYNYVNEEIRAGRRGIGGSSLVVQSTGSHRFLVKHPRTAFSDGMHLSVPIMGGTTRDEGSSFLTTFYNIRQLAKVNDSRYFERKVIEDMLSSFGYDDRHGLLADTMRSLYFPNGKPALKLEDVLPGLMDICGVTLLKASTYDVLRIMSNSRPSYSYSFNFYGGISKVRAAEPDWSNTYPFPPGVAHSDELGYLFPSSQSNYTSRELKMVKSMVDLWTNFIRFGAPTRTESNGSDGQWMRMSTPNGPYLRISDRLELRDSFLDEYTIAHVEGFVTGGAGGNLPLWSLCCFLNVVLCIVHQR